MKALAISSSPRGGGYSRTEMMLTPLVEGMRGAGAEVEVVHLRDKKVRHCIGCFSCWTKTPGQCVHKDDMTQELFGKWQQADLAVYASPLYFHTLNASMMTFIERTLPNEYPFLEQGEHGTRHPLRHKPPKVVVLSVCGFPEKCEFDALSAYAKRTFGEHLAAEMYRSAGEALPNMPEPIRNDVLDATRQAGRELAETSAISPETLARVEQPLFHDVSAYHAFTNLFCRACIAAGMNYREFEGSGQRLRPDSIETFTALLSFGFNPEAARDVDAVIQFKFAGPVSGACHFVVKDGRVSAKTGAADRADLTVESPFDLWADILAGKTAVHDAFSRNQCKAAGNLALLKVFGP